MRAKATQNEAAITTSYMTFGQMADGTWGFCMHPPMFQGGEPKMMNGDAMLHLQDVLSRASMAFQAALSGYDLKEGC